MANSFASGFTVDSAASGQSEILRNSAFANHATVTSNLGGQKPFYYVSSSTGVVPSNPNSLRDMGPLRNCQYRMSDDLNVDPRVTWKDIYKGDE